jgi:hypothetical protein
MPLRMCAATRAHAQEHSHACLEYFEAFATIAIGGVDTDMETLVNLRFIEGKTVLLICSLVLRSKGRCINSQAVLDGCER